MAVNSVAILLAGCALFLYTYDRGILKEFVVEDGLVESLTVVLYCLAALFFILANKRQSFKQLWYWGYTLLFILIAAEEISWGQRIFNIGGPRILIDANVQQEMNIHNIKGIHEHIRFVGVCWFLAVCYFIPITNKLSQRIKVIYEAIKMPIFPLEGILLPTFGILFMAVPRIIVHHEIFAFDEMGEFFMSLAFLLFAFFEYYRVKPNLLKR